MAYQTNLYSLQALTHLHVGSGNTNFGVVDKLVQRDVITKLPTIHESGLKGSIRAQFAYCLAIKNELKNDPPGKDAKSKIQKANQLPTIKTIFGDSADGSGNYRFLGGQLISFPARVSAKEPFLHATCPTLLKNLLDLANELSVPLPDKESIQALSKLTPAQNKPLVFDTNYVGLTVEYPDMITVNADTNLVIPDWLGGKKLVLMSLDDFNSIAGPDQLPVIARNNLEDGRSTNLWYEEIVPRQSLFSIFIVKTDVNAEADAFFEECLKTPVQVGANATIGYGLMKLTKLV